MGRALGLLTALRIARVAIPTYVESLAGEVSRERSDARLHDFARRVVAGAGMRITVEGTDHVPADRPLVYMSNHQSHLDIPVLYATVPSPSLRMVAKTELFRLPVWGRSMRAVGTIEIDRRDRERAIASLERAGARIRDGLSVWIAPEGSRSPDGRLRPLKKGGFHLARAAGVPIVPVAIDGTRNALPKGSTSVRRDVAVRVVYGPPIEVEGRSVESLMEEVAAFLHANVASDQDSRSV